ncbi:hypothetical protein ACQPW1_36385 [Nocardia sp. CA-128927]|uniref:hypothetical protein n=1 Tax=Nocardia sp. CA-128927 TaxID=3239975 RepID=UPI003D993930
MPSNPISSMMTLVIPLFFALAVLTAPPVAAESPAGGSFEPSTLVGGPPRSAVCTGSFCGLVHPAPLRVAEGVIGLPLSGVGLDPFAITPLDPEFCEYVGPAPFFVSPSDSEFCGLVSPAPLALPTK